MISQVAPALFGTLIYYLCLSVSPKKNHWVYQGAFGLGAVGVLFLIFEQFKQPMPGVWIKNWLVLPQATSAFSVGITTDLMSLLFTGLTLLCAGVLLVWEQQAEAKVKTAVTLSVVGLGLSWSAATPMTSFLGYVFTILSSCVFYLEQSKNQTLADSFSVFFGNRVLSLFMMLCGVVFIDSWLGVAFSLLAMLNAFRVVPFSDWTFSEAKMGLGSLETYFYSLIPGSSMSAFLFKNADSIYAFGWFEWGRYVLIAVLVLTVLADLSQKKTALGFIGWMSGGLLFGAVVIGVLGKEHFFSYHLCLYVYSIVHVIISDAKRTEKTTTGEKTALLILPFFVFGLTGAIQKVGVFALNIEGDQVSLGILSTGLFFTSFALFRQVLKSISLNHLRFFETRRMGVFVGLSILVGVWFGFFDHIYFLSTQKQLGFSEHYWGPAIVGGTLLLSLGLTLFVFRRKVDLFSEKQAFVENGFGVSVVFEKFYAAVLFLGEHLFLWFEKFKERDRFLQKISIGMDLLEQKIWSRFTFGVRSALEGPTKAFELIYYKDLRWYLFWGIGCTIIIILNAYFLSK